MRAATPPTSRAGDAVGGRSRCPKSYSESARVTSGSHSNNWKKPRKRLYLLLGRLRQRAGWVVSPKS